jgi:hypothetical protein
MGQVPHGSVDRKERGERGQLSGKSIFVEPGKLSLP